MSILNQGWQSFSVKDMTENVLDSVSVTTTQLCSCSVKAAIDNTYITMCNSILIKPYLQKLLVGGIWPKGFSLLTPKHLKGIIAKC